jgi:hypothetical protein
MPSTSAVVSKRQGDQGCPQDRRLCRAVRAADAIIESETHHERPPAKALFKTPITTCPTPGHFGPYGGSFVAETLSHALAELNEAYARYSKDPEFLEEFRYELKHFVGRPSPIYHAKRWSEQGPAARRSTSSAKT